MSSSPRNPTNESGYNLWASFYDSYPNPTVAIDELSFPKVYAELQHQTVLEVGCGTGRHTSRLLAAKNRVTGIDISEGMLSKLKEKIKDSNLELIKGDFLEEEIREGHYDAIIASLVLEHISDLPKFFERARRTLKAQGRIYLSEIHPARTSKGIFAHFKNPDGSETHLSSSAHTTEAISMAATRAGFEIVEVLSVEGSHELATINTNWSKHLGHPMIQIWKMQLNR